MNLKSNEKIPDSTAVRVALWRAIHVQSDALPHILDDEIGFKLVDPPEDWRERPDMHPSGTAPFRASIVARARFIEDLVSLESKAGVNQYVLLGAGLDTFALRRGKELAHLKIFEIDKGDTQEWKKERLTALGFSKELWPQFVPVNFEENGSWWDELSKAGFEKQKRAIVASTGVSMYLTLEAIKETLHQMTNLARGSQFIMTFLLPIEMVAAEDKVGYERSMKGAALSGTPFISFFTPDEMMKLARKAGFKEVECIATSDMISRYFAGRKDGLRPSTGEVLLIART